MKQYIRNIVVFTTFVMGSFVASAYEGDKILGVYRVLAIETREASNVKVYKNGDTYEAQIIWLQKPLDDNGNPRFDVLNPNPALRSVRGDQIVIIKGLKYNPKNKRWGGGKVYNPEIGKVYDVMAEIDGPNKLKIRGYLGTPALGKSFTWIKIK